MFKRGDIVRVRTLAGDDEFAHWTRNLERGVIVSVEHVQFDNPNDYDYDREDESIRYKIYLFQTRTTIEKTARFLTLVTKDNADEI